MLTFTDRARDMVRTFIDQSDGELPYLRITVDGSPLSPTFALTLVGEDERDPGETEIDLGDFTVLVSDAHAPRLDGATVDFVERVNESGFEVQPAPASRRASPETNGAGETSGDDTGGPMADRVREVLDSQVNPAIAAHGGHIGLVDVKDTEVFLEMSGGCQGCAMSRLTLQQGVERMLRQAVPEISAVHDVTDHASGTNPFYEAPV